MEMIAHLTDALSWVMIVSGGFFLVTGALGLLRMPDVYTRMHAASVIDTLGAGLMLGGLMLQSGFDLVTIKLIFVLLLILFFSPVVSHALAQAALAEDIKPVLSEDRREARDGVLEARGLSAEAGSSDEKGGAK